MYIIGNRRNWLRHFVSGVRSEQTSYIKMTRLPSPSIFFPTFNRNLVAPPNVGAQPRVNRKASGAAGLSTERRLGTSLSRSPDLIYLLVCHLRSRQSGIRCK